MNSSQRDERMRRLGRRCLQIGLVASLLLLGGAVLDPDQFLRSYLTGYLFWLGVALGSFGVWMLHNMTGGEWGFPIRRALESASQTFPLLLLLFLPLVAGMGRLYLWTDAARVAGDPLLEHKSLYLDSTFFLLRAALYFALWIGLATLLRRWSLGQDRNGDERLTNLMQDVSGPGLVMLGLTVTFASVDWVMSLEPHWFSTIYGLLFLMGQVLSALAFMIVLLGWLSEFPPLDGLLRPKHFHDLGNLTLAFVMLWAYMAFSQFLIIWSGNLPEEIPFYIARSRGGWQWVALFLVVFHFAVPFLLLLSRTRKSSRSALGRLALWILLARLVDLHWMIAPAFGSPTVHLHWMDLLSPLAVGGIWMWAFLGQLEGIPLVPLHDPRLEQVAPVEGT